MIKLYKLLNYMEELKVI